MSGQRRVGFQIRGTPICLVRHTDAMGPSQNFRDVEQAALHANDLVVFAPAWATADRATGNPATDGLWTLSLVRSR